MIHWWSLPEFVRQCNKAKFLCRVDYKVFGPAAEVSTGHRNPKQKLNYRNKSKKSMLTKQIPSLYSFSVYEKRIFLQWQPAHNVMSCVFLQIYDAVVKVICSNIRAKSATNQRSPCRWRHPCCCASRQRIAILKQKRCKIKPPMSITLPQQHSLILFRAIQKKGACLETRRLSVSGTKHINPNNQANFKCR